MNIHWSDADWSYLLGVIHGDGSIAPRSLDVAVSYKDADYADMLVALWRSLGFNPKVYRARTALKLSVHSADLRRAFSPYKSKGCWSVPDGIDAGHYLGGVFDTDGCVAKPASKHVSIVLKRSGNLRIVADMVAGLGIRPVTVNERTTKFKGKAYEIEEIKLSGMDRVVVFSDTVHLRHPRKVRRLQEMRAHIDELLARVPLWRRVGEWLQQEPRTCDEIAAHFSLTWEQVQSALQRVKANAEVEVIPPPRNLTRYLVKSPFYSQGH